MLSEEMINRNHLSAIETGLDELKVLFTDSLRGKEDSFLKDLPNHLVAIAKQLRMTGVDEAHIISLMKYLTSLPVDQLNKKAEDAAGYCQSQAIKWMLKQVKIAPQFEALPGSMAIHAIVGATGAGKTSTIAKLVFQMSKKSKGKILLISCDNQRLAAAEQLRLYSKLANVVFESVNDLKDIRKVIEKHSNMEMVLIDTAGRSPKNSNVIKELELLKSVDLPIDIHLAMSITDKELHLDRTIRSFSGLGIQSLMFTKLDESWSYGEIFNLSTKWSIPLSYFTTGQRIPEDIERASKERVVERIFGI
jgi:flagellar biosynthesis protein FlhF